jgi:hypothetical protein
MRRQDGELTVMDWKEVLLSKDWLWGAIAGFALALIGDWLSDRRRRAQERRMAALCVATELCSWIDKTRDDVYEMKNRQVPYGEQDCAANTLDPLPFERSLEQVSRLSHEMGRSIIKLIRTKNSENDSIRVLAEYGDQEDLPDAYLRSAAQVCLEANAIYARLAKIVGLREPALEPGTAAMLKSEIARVEEAERRAENRRENFADFENESTATAAQASV